MAITGFDHIVISVADVARTVAFYRDVLGVEAREERAGKWALYFGEHKISIQQEDTKPKLAAFTTPGTANFCVLSDEPVEDWAKQLRAADVEILEGPAQKDGATGAIWSIYFRDPDGNLVEIANPL